MAAASPNPRASLLSGLRTGGVRSTSATVPHTAAPGGSFNVPRFASQLHSSVFPEEDDDQIVDVPGQTIFASRQVPRAPMTAAVDGPDNRFTQQQQQRGMNPNVAPFTPSFLPHQPVQPVQPVQSANANALQMQMMQIEIMKMQAMQQYQHAQLVAQAQAQVLLQQQAQQSPRRASFNPPATAGPLSTTFDLRSATLRRAAQNNVTEDQVPMTAALDGRFGSRPSSISGTPMSSRFAVGEGNDAPASLPPTPHTTTVISGGTSLGSPASNTNGTPSKSDSASTWRRGGNNNSVLSGNNRSPSVKVTPPPAERRISPPPVASPTPANKARPQPLRFSVVASQPMPAVAIDETAEEDNDEDEADADSSGSSNSNASSPHSASTNGTPLSPREEAAKKLYEGLGIGRPVSAVADQQQFAAASVHRMASQPVRQPHGPPSSVDELGLKNFATRIRRQAIGGLGALMNSRERREFVQV